MSKELLLVNDRGQIPIQHAMRKGDRIICPNKDEYSISWNEQRQAVEVIKTHSEGGDIDVSINRVGYNHIYIK